jgi:general secretion pathway protein J
MMVALLLFALISTAGFALIETVLGIQRRTESRAAYLAEVQRARFLIGTDFAQLTGGPSLDGGGGVSLQRAHADAQRRVTYRLAGTTLHREIDGKERAILHGVTALDWRFATADGKWQNAPPAGENDPRPRAVELTMQLVPESQGAGGRYRQMIELPEK